MIRRYIACRNRHKDNEKLRAVSSRKGCLTRRYNESIYANTASSIFYRLSSTVRPRQWVSMLGQRA